jgi:predicted nuclease of predicted toxin-antitoxin system
MPRTIKFHLDENCDPRIAAGLRLHGIDVSTAADAGLLHATDDQHLAYAVAQGRAISTQDTDFLRIAAAGQGHPGILFFPDQERSVGQVSHMAHLFWELCEPEELASQVHFL